MRNLESLPSTTEFIQPIPQGGLEIGLNHLRNASIVSEPLIQITLGLPTTLETDTAESTIVLKPDQHVQLYGVGYDASIMIKHPDVKKDPWNIRNEKRERIRKLIAESEARFDTPIFLNPKS